MGAARFGVDLLEVRLYCYIDNDTSFISKLYRRKTEVSILEADRNPVRWQEGLRNQKAGQ